MLPNPSLALQASMAREVSFPNGASSAGGPTNVKLQRRGNHGESEIDGAVTVRERDLITDRIPIDFVNQSASRSPGTSFPGYVGSRSLTVTALSGLLARIIGKGTHSFFPVRSGAAGGAAKLKLQQRADRFAVIATVEGSLKHLLRSVRLLAIYSIARCASARMEHGL